MWHHLLDGVCLTPCHRNPQPIKVAVIINVIHGEIARQADIPKDQIAPPLRIGSNARIHVPDATMGSLVGADHIHQAILVDIGQPHITG